MTRSSFWLAIALLSTTACTRDGEVGDEDSSTPLDSADTDTNTDTDTSDTDTDTAETDRAPVAIDDAALVLEGGTVSVSALDNDEEGTAAIDAASLAITSDPLFGEVVVEDDGSLTYNHDGSEAPLDTFEYEVADENGLVSAPALVTITVSQVNDPPVAGDDAATLDEGGTVFISLTANDSDADDGFDLSGVEIVSFPANGEVVNNGDGSVKYTHDGSETTSDSLTYQLRDRSSAPSGLATVSLTITPVNDVPVGKADAASVDEGAQVVLAVASNDSDVDDGLDLSSVTIVREAVHGSIAVSGGGLVTYVHDGSETTSDSFTYTVADKGGQTTEETSVALTVKAVNDAPTARADQLTVDEGAGGTVSVLANDSDPDSLIDTGSVFITEQPTKGIVAVQNDGRVTYTHDGSESTADGFKYRVSDQSGAVSESVGVVVTVTPVNDAPVAADDDGEGREGTTFVIDLASNDSDVDGTIDGGSIEIVSGPASASINVNSDGTVDYVHDGTHEDSDSFTYRIRDNGGASSNVASVSVAIELGGCTDNTAVNYDDQADFDDGTCVFVACSNGSGTSCNPSGSVLISGSDYLDPEPPDGWSQCAGFVNTPGDDVTANVLDNCLNTNRLRIRVWNSSGALEEDVMSTNINNFSSWPHGNYLGGSIQRSKQTFWTGNTTYYTRTDGRGACGTATSHSGVVLGTGNGNSAAIFPGATDGFEWRVNCGGQQLPGRTIALYK